MDQKELGEFALFVRRVRNESGLGIKALAKKLKVRPSTVSAWINDASKPTMQRMPQIRAALAELIPTPQPQTGPVTVPEGAPVDMRWPDEVEAEPVASVAPKPRMRSLMPEDRRWDV